MIEEGDSIVLKICNFICIHIIKTNNPLDKYINIDCNFIKWEGYPLDHLVRILYDTVIGMIQM